MKTRTDFISNSSSSSFIIQDAGFFELFGITADDIREAIIDLSGGKELRAKNLAAEIARCNEMLSKPDADSFDKEYYAERKARLEKNGLEDFVVYDMENPEEREACYSKWDSHFSEWIAPNKGADGRWREFEDMLKYNCDFFNVLDVINGKDQELVASTYDKKTGKWTETPFAGGAAFVKHVKEQLGIKTMKEVLHDEKTTLLIHFADNEVYNIKGMVDEGQMDARSYHTAEENEKCKASGWESEMYSRERFFEILIKHFIAKGKVDLSDPKLMEFWRIPEGSWIKAEFKDRKYYTNAEDHATWLEVVDDVLCDSTIMHEG